MRFRAALLIALSSIDTPMVAEPPTATDRISFAGIGEARIGMPLWNLLEVLEQQTTLNMVDNDCTYVVPEDQRLGLSFMIISGTLARIDVEERGVATLSGIKVGDTEAAVNATYPSRVEVTDHESGHYLTVKSADGHSAVVFETNGRVVTSFRVGRLPAAQYGEGCH